MRHITRMKTRWNAHMALNLRQFRFSLPNICKKNTAALCTSALGCMKRIECRRIEIKLFIINKGRYFGSHHTVYIYQGENSLVSSTLAFVFQVRFTRYLKKVFTQECGTDRPFREFVVILINQIIVCSLSWDAEVVSSIVICNPRLWIRQ